MKFPDDFFRSVSIGCFASSTIGGSGVTLYGTVYWYLAQYYLGRDVIISDDVKNFIISAQTNTSGLFVGPELKDFIQAPGALHDFEHLAFHSTCSTLPFVQEHHLPLEPISAAHKFCCLDFLARVCVWVCFSYLFICFCCCFCLCVLLNFVAALGCYY